MSRALLHEDVFNLRWVLHAGPPGYGTSRCVHGSSDMPDRYVSQGPLGQKSEAATPEEGTGTE